jgi:hypothetical protein
MQAVIHFEVAALESRVAATLLYTGVSPWNGVSEELKPRSGDTGFVNHVAWRAELWRSVWDWIRFHGLTPVAREIPPLRGSRKEAHAARHFLHWNVQRELPSGDTCGAALNRLQSCWLNHFAATSVGNRYTSSRLFMYLRVKHLSDN